MIKFQRYEAVRNIISSQNIFINIIIKKNVKSMNFSYKTPIKILDELNLSEEIKNYIVMDIPQLNQI